MQKIMKEVVFLPINHFKNRSEDAKYPSRLKKGDLVLIIEKENQGTRDPSKLVKGRIVRVYSKGDYYENGAKVQVILDKTDPRFPKMGFVTFVGRVQYIVQKVDEEENPFFDENNKGFYDL